MELEIRHAGIDDATIIADVICDSWRSAYRDIIPPEVLARYTDVFARRCFFERLLASGVDNFIIALDGENPCGICSYRSSRDAGMPGWGEIVGLYTLEEYWDKGVGRALMDAEIAGLFALGFDRVMLWTLEANARARRFYEKYGFRHDGAVKDSGICSLPEVRYVLNRGLPKTQI